MLKEKELLKLYEEGVNISNYLREKEGIDYNSQDIIELSYDIQASSYINALNDELLKQHKIDYSKEIAKIISELCDAKNVMEAGVGEGTTLIGVMKNMDKDISFYGFDISFSRVAYAKKWLAEQGVFNIDLCTGELLALPYLDNSIDVVYTSHSIEPNRGSEDEILKELYRVTNKYLVLLEPAYELTTDENRERMDSHKYCQDLNNKAINLGYEVIKHELFPFSARQTNPTAITIIKKDNNNKALSSVYACPKHKSALKKFDEVYFSEDALCVYPIINKIPCLREKNSIIASKYEELGFK